MRYETALASALAALALAMPLSIAATNIALGLLAALLLYGAAAKKELAWGQVLNPAVAGLGLYLAAAVLATAGALDPKPGLRAIPKDIHKLWCLAMFLVALRSSPRPNPLPFLGAGFCAASLIGIGQTLFQRAPDGQTWIRAHAFVHPVTFGEQLALACLGALCLYGRRESGLDGPRARRLAAAFLALTGATVLLNQTRGALLGLAAGFAAAAVLDGRLRRWTGRAVLAAAAALILWEFLPTGRSWIATISEQGLAPIVNQQFDRVVFWKVAWRAFQDHPWLGVGPGNYYAVFDRYFAGVVAGQKVWGSAHNLYLHQLAERGLIGLGALLTALGLLLARAAARARRDPNGWNLWALSATVAFLVMNLTEVAFQNEQVTTLFLFAWALGEARGRDEGKA